MSKEGLRYKDLGDSLYKKYANLPVTKWIGLYLLMKLEIHDEGVHSLFYHTLNTEL